MSHFEKRLSSEILYEGRVFTATKDTVETEDGNHATREVVRHNGGVAILAADDADNLLFVRQFRYPFGEVLLELPAGKLEKGEAPAECGMRELEEETGYRAETLELLAEIYPSPGYLTEILYLYTAKNLKPTCQNLDAGEFLTVEKIPLKKALEMCLSGEIKDSKTLTAIMKYSLLNNCR